jgi:small subunit ribosomal protein S15
MVDKEKKDNQINFIEESRDTIIKTFATHEGDNGSPEVQAALFTQRILQLSEHLKQNKKDNHSRRGLLQLIGKRRRIISFLGSIDEERYAVLIKKLGLKK